MASDDDLRDKLTEALLSTREWLTSAEGGWAADLADALMPVVVEALAEARAAEYRRAYRIGYDDGRRRNGWISDSASACAYDPDGYFEWARSRSILRDSGPEDRRRP